MDTSNGYPPYYLLTYSTMFLDTIVSMFIFTWVEENGAEVM